VLAALRGDDLILCQITSQLRADGYSVPLEDSDFVIGGLQQSSRIRPERLFTAESSIIIYRAGQISVSKLKEARDKLISILYQT
jgi:mRNA interferase MazF